MSKTSKENIYFVKSGSLNSHLVKDTAFLTSVS